MAGVPFDFEEVQQGLVRVLTQMVGDQLGSMVTPGGTVTTTPAVFIAPLNNLPEPTLPFIELNYLQDNDNDGFLFDSGVVEVEDPSDPPNLISVPYYDTHLRYTIMLGCEGDGATKILREISKKMLVPSYRDLVHQEMNSGIDLITTNNRNPQLLDTQFREQGTMVLTFTTIDRLIDYDGAIFEEVSYEGGLAKNPEDENPLPLDNDVGPVYP